MEVRDYIPQDCAALARLFYKTVHAVNAREYTQEQLDAWATGYVDLDAWNRSFLDHHTLVAEEDGLIVGFADMDAGGYLDRLYVHEGYQGQGVATGLCDRLEAAGGPFTTHASITAKPFFEKRGYAIIKEQQVIRRGVYLTNYLMEKR